MLAVLSFLSCLARTPRVELLWKREIGGEVRQAYNDLSAISETGDAYWLESRLPPKPESKVSVSITKVTRTGKIAYRTTLDLGIDPGKCDSLKPTPEGGIIAMVTRAKFVEIGGRNIEHAAVKLTPVGRVAWTAVFVGTPSGPLVAKDGSLFFSTSNVFRRSILKLSASGQPIWEFPYETSGDSYPKYLSPAADDGSGGLWVSGSLTGENGIMHLNAKAEVDTAFFLPEKPIQMKLTSESPTRASVDAELPWLRADGQPKGVRLTQFRLTAPGEVETTPEMSFELPYRADQLGWLAPDPLWIFRSFDPNGQSGSRYLGGLLHWNAVRVRSWLSDGDPDSSIAHASMLENRVWTIWDSGQYTLNHSTIACLDRESLTPVWSAPLAQVLREEIGEDVPCEARATRRVGDRDLLVAFVGKRLGVAKLRLYN